MERLPKGGSTIGDSRSRRCDPTWKVDLCYCLEGYILPLLDLSWNITSKTGVWIVHTPSIAVRFHIYLHGGSSLPLKTVHWRWIFLLRFGTPKCSTGILDLQTLRPFKISKHPPKRHPFNILYSCITLIQYLNKSLTKSSTWIHLQNHPKISSPKWPKKKHSTRFCVLK